MPKNTTGGKGHKKQANKGSNFIQRDYKITSHLELEGHVDKILGNGMIRVNSTNGKYIGLICKIRAKFAQRNKSRNRVEINGIVIVGLREWESPHKTCDLLYVCNGSFKKETDECGEDDGIDFKKKTEYNDGIVFEATAELSTDLSTDNHIVLENNETDNNEVDENDDIDMDDI
jgi:translation initiation factor IF-1